jgi:hypothetical protein
MIEDYTQELNRISLEEERIANLYRDARISSAEAGYKISIKLAKNIDRIREGKKSIGYDMALIELLKGDDLVIKEQYRIKEEEEANYKGLEKILDALAGRRIAIQGIMKYNVQAEYNQR